MTTYEMTEHAYHLIDGGWTGADEDLFREEDAKQDRPLTPDDITGIFEEIGRIERETSSAEQSQSVSVTTRYGELVPVGSPVMDNYKDHAAYFWTAYNPTKTDDLGCHPAFSLIYTVPDDLTDPDDIDWADPDDIQPAGAYDASADRIY